VYGAYSKFGVKLKTAFCFFKFSDDDSNNLLFAITLTKTVFKLERDVLISMFTLEPIVGLLILKKIIKYVEKLSK
jgi:hypothetical protein